jgi:hypothetical protein
MISQQYACEWPTSADRAFQAINSSFLSVRAQKALGLVNGTPDYNEVSGFVVPDVPARIQNYSADGRLYAYALPAV